MTLDIALDAPMPAASRDDWMALVAKVLKGGDFEKRLVSRTADGIRLEPLHGLRRDATPIVSGAPATPWRVVQRVDHPDPVQASTQALADLEGGSNGLALVFAGARSARGNGLVCDGVEQLDRALQGVMLDLISLRLETSGDWVGDAALAAALIARRGHEPGAVDIDFALDPIGLLASRGALDADWNSVASSLAETISALRSRGFRGPFVGCDARPYHEAGASAAQELAAAVATGACYLRSLVEAGLPIEDVRRQISWKLAVDADQIATIAKLRALRRLWARVEDAIGLAPRPIRIEAETAWRMMTSRDAAVNMLRATMATFSAGVGGADAISVLPYTSPLGLPDAFARRVARNTMIVLIEEAGLARVADPAAGAGAFEAMTDELAKAAWVEFQRIESEGGMVRSLVSGAIQRRIAGQREALSRDVATRRAPITGTSEFAALSEPAVRVLTPDAAYATALAAAGSRMRSTGFATCLAAAGEAASVRSGQPATAAPAVTAAPLPAERLAADFEALRDAADAHMAATGTRPGVFIAALGAVAEHGARATWIRNLLAAGGIEAIEPKMPVLTSGEMGAAFAASGAKIACLCGTDEAYALIGDATVQALKSAGASHVVLAGKPGPLEASLRASGCDGFVFVGQDMVEILKGLQARAIAG